jgi:tight adherence protein C
MNFALSLLASAGLYLITYGAIFGSRLRLVNRLRVADVKSFRMSTVLLSYRDAVRAQFTSRKRLTLASSELPEILDLMSVALSAGDGIYGALARVVPRANGVLADSLEALLGSLELGGELEAELSRLAKRLPHPQIIEFTNKLLMALRRGTPLAQMLSSLSNSARADQRNHLLKQVGRNETKMLIPLVFLILPVTVMFAVYPSLQLLSIDYI